MFNYDPWSPQLRSMMSQMATQNNPQMPLPQPQTVQIPTVHGAEAARNYTLPPSSSAIVMDADDLIFNVIITEASKNLCKSKGIDYEQAKRSVSNEINTISKER